MVNITLVTWLIRSSSMMDRQPGLIRDSFNKHLKITPAMVMGYMNQMRQNIHPTIKESKTGMKDDVVTPVRTGIKTDLVYAMVIDQ
jgi:hypothetical protein